MDLLLVVPTELLPEEVYQIVIIMICDVPCDTAGYEIKIEARINQSAHHVKGAAASAHESCQLCWRARLAR